MPSVLKAVDEDGVVGKVAMVTDGAIAVVGTVQGRLRDRYGPSVVMPSVLKVVDKDGAAGGNLPW
jgi:hypothetical protein